MSTGGPGGPSDVGKISTHMWILPWNIKPIINPNGSHDTGSDIFVNITHLIEIFQKHLNMHC